jgi:integrase/recombinase XerD
MARVRPEPKWWSELSTGYLRSLARRGRRPKTQKSYRLILHGFGRWLYHAEVGTLSDLNRGHIEAWQDDLQRRLKPGTQKLDATVLRQALKWAANEDLPLSTPTLWLRVAQPSAPRLKPRPIPVRDLAAIQLRLDGWCDVPGRATLPELRTRALFRLILSSGARITEALSLTRISVVDGTALVIQKGGSEHLLVISKKAEAAINDYLRARTDSGIALFISHESSRPLGPLGQLEAQRAWDRLCTDLGISRFTNHQIRHSCATELIRRHIDSMVVAKHMGHRSLASIAGYTEIDLESRREAMVALDGRLAG